MTFRVGMKVVCVDDTWEDIGWEDTPNKPVLGGIYTIRHIADWWNDSDLGFLLDEIVNPEEDWDDGRSEVYFWAARFRPIVSRKTDISIFTRMLTPQEVDA